MSWAVVTGASRGIGLATSVALARRGYAVAMLGPSRERLAHAESLVEAAGADALAIGCDVSSEHSVAEASRQVLEVAGAPDIVVNNAGIVYRNTRIEDVTLQAWTEVVDTNLTGAFLVTRAFLPAMRARDAGRLVFVASISSTIGSPGAASYAASKWGLVGFAKSLAEEIRGTGLAAMSVLPGSVDTDMLKGSGFTPLMEPEDVARTIVFAAIDAPSAMNGSAIEVFG